jgi:putative transport protein
MIDWFLAGLRSNPELALFLAIGLGFWIGSRKIAGFSLGGVTGSLLAALVIGQAHVEIPGLVKTVLFMLFLFGTGYSVGPQFFRSLKGDGLRALAFTLVHCVAALGIAYVMARLLSLDLGMSAGLLSGGLTHSAAIGTATEVIMTMPSSLSDAERQVQVSHIAVADALTYVFGVVAPIWFLGTLAPRLLRIDLKQEAAALEAKLGIKRDAPNVTSAYQQFVFRAHRVDADAYVGKRVAELEVIRPDGRMIRTHALSAAMSSACMAVASWSWSWGRRSAPRSTTASCSISRWRLPALSSPIARSPNAALANWPVGPRAVVSVCATSRAVAKTFRYRRPRCWIAATSSS